MEQSERNDIPEASQPAAGESRFSVGRRLWHWAKRTILAVALLLLLLTGLLQVPAVQNWLAMRITAALSETMQTTVSISRLNVTFLNRLLLEDFYIEDLSPGDTALYSRRLYADININPYVYLRYGLVIEELALDSAVVNIRRAEGQQQNNIEVLLGRLFPPADTLGAKKDKRPFRFDVKTLSLTQIRFLKEDQVYGKHLDVYLAAGEAAFDRFDLAEKTIHAKSLSLRGPYVRLEEFPEKLPPGYVPPDDVESEPQEAIRPLFITIGDFQLEDGKFSLHNWRNSPVKESPPDQLDYQHLDVFDINIGIADFAFCSDSLDFEGKVREFNLRDLSGFVLEDLTVDQGRVWSRGVELYGMKLKTPYSELGDTLVFRYDTYEDFQSFPTQVAMELQLNSATVTLQDIMTFAPGLNANAFFQSNRDRKLYVDGSIRGTVNKFNARDMFLALENRQIVLEGSLSTNDLIEGDFRTINLRLKELRTNMRALKQLFPRFRPPEAFDRLGGLYFTGSFDVLFSDYIAYGNLRTALGSARMDMQLRNLDNARSRASYSGSLDLINFDLGAFSENKDFGLVNFSSSVKNGSGLTAETASADLEAKVQGFAYKGYNYQDADLTGKLQKNLFEGKFVIHDDHIDFAFDGQVNLRDSVPTFNFNANVNRLAMKPLNLSERDVVLSAGLSLDLQNSKLAELEGRGRISRFAVEDRQRQRSATVDSVRFSSFFEPDGRKHFQISSDLMKADLVGEFDIERIPAAFMDYLNRSYPEFFERLGLKAPSLNPMQQKFTYNIDIFDTKGLLFFADEKLGPVVGANLEGSFDNTLDDIDISALFPRFEYGNIVLNDLGLVGRLELGAGSLHLRIENPVLNEKTRLSPITLIADLDRDLLNLGLNYQTSGGYAFDELNLNTTLYLEDSLNYGLKFSYSDLILLESPWLIDTQNIITFRKGYVNTDHFRLTNRGRVATLSSFGERGLKLGLEHFDLEFINELWAYEELDFRGDFDLSLEVEDLFELKGFKVYAAADTFGVNGDDWGAFRMEVSAEDLDSPYQGNISMLRDTAQLRAKGYYNPKDNRRARRGEDKDKAKYFNIDLDVRSFPFHIAEYWLGQTISNTVGSFDTKLNIYGFPGEAKIGGELYVRDGATTVDFLNARYYFDRDTIWAGDRLFDATGAVVRDKYGNTATVQGGITHRHLKDLGINAKLNTQRFLALNTGKADNELFYGHALGQGEVTFRGPLNRVDIYVNAIIGRDTRLVIPVSSGSSTSELQFVTFTEPSTVMVVPEREEGKPGQGSPQQQLNTGVNLEMDLIITEEAQGEIIFDEQAGDIIRGKGRGNIRILVPRNGEFQIFGDYNIVEGDYLFTLYNVVNKYFSIKQGGLITWSGDPFDAQIRLEAEYSALTTPVSNFIQEYLTDAPAELRQSASQVTSVDLTMDLRGDLLQPLINFDISFPLLTGGLKTLTDSKLRLLKQDPNEMNRQVFGLIVVGQFLPSDLAIQGTDIFYNTVSEFVSNQLSLLLTDLVSEFLGDDSPLAGLDFDVAYNQYQANFGDNRDLRRGEEFQLRLRQAFFDDRFLVAVGGNLNVGNNVRVPNTSGTFIGNDLVLEYVLNRDRTLKLRVYQRLQPDIGGGSRLEVGTGVSYRKEFDSFSEFLESLRKEGRRVR